MKAQMTLFAPTAKDAERELASIAKECGAAPKIINVLPQGGHNWLVSYTANDSTVRAMEQWVS